MLSIARIENLKQGLLYYQQDNYYAKDEAIGFTQWYGLAAKELGLSGKVDLNAFSKALHGVSIEGKLGLAKGNNRKDETLSYEKLFEFRAKTKTYLDSLPFCPESKLKIQLTLDKISQTPQKLRNSHLENCQNKIFSIINKESNLTIAQKMAIKNHFKAELEVFQKSPSRRPGYDLTFSAPKSISMAALVGGDQLLLEAHRESVAFALKIVEQEYSQTRLRDGVKAERLIEVSGNMAAALFEHDVSRKTDPQLHTHCVLMNFTKRKDGSWRSLYQDGFYYDSKKIGLIYQNELAKRAQALGYEIKVHKNGTFDLLGYSEEQLTQFSKRTQQLRELGALSQKQASKLVKVNRNKKEKDLPPDLRLKKWRQECVEMGITHPIKQLTFQSAPKSMDTIKIKELIGNGIKELTTNDVSFKKAKLETLLLEHLLGKKEYQYDSLKKIIDAYLSENAQKTPANLAQYVPNALIEVEKKTISLMLRGRDLFENIYSKEQAQALLQSMDHTSKQIGQSGLNEGQRAAIELVLTSHDRVIAWQGSAGAGKSFSLGEVNKILTREGYLVKGYAPSAQAAQVLALEAKLTESNTVAFLLQNKPIPGKAKGKELWIIDEASLLGSKEAYELLKKAEVENARIILVGDTKQLSAVSAGNPFKQLQQQGLLTAYLSKGIRQKDSTLKNSVELIASGKQQEALEVLDKANKINEFSSSEEIIATMAKDYLQLNEKNRENSLFISSTNYEKEAVTNLVRAQLKSTGNLHGSINIGVLNSLDYNENALKYCRSYSVNDVVILNKKSQGLAAQTPYEVTSIHRILNKITVKINEGHQEIDVSKINACLYRKETLEICVNDKIKWTKNHAIESKLDEIKNTGNNRRLNGESFVITQIDKIKNTAIIEYHKGKREEIDLRKRQFLDYNYVSTVYASQGKTCDKVYASLQLVDKENFYVAISRAKHDCKIYVENKDMLFKNVIKSGANQTAIEKISKLNENFSTIFNKEHIDNNYGINKKERGMASENRMSLARLNRKIREASFEVVYKLNLDPEKSCLKEIYKIPFSNQEIVEKILHQTINKSLGVKDSPSRSNLSSNILFKAYKHSPNNIEDTFNRISGDLKAKKITYAGDSLHEQSMSSFVLKPNNLKNKPKIMTH